MTFWGVRGSIPTPGEDTSRWGGNSSCLEVRAPGEAPLVFDQGTGARKLGFKLVGEPGRELDLLFTHFHMDHVFGFPFFIPIYTPGYQVRVTIPAYSVDEAREKLSRYLNGVYHPTRLRDLPAQLSFEAIRPGRPFQRGGFDIEGVQLNHPGGAVGYRVTHQGRSMAYITDTSPFVGPGEGLLAGQAPPPREAAMVRFLQGVDLVVYDTMYELDEYLEKMTWGHSYPEYAAALCKAACVRQLVLFHHSPADDDDVLDRRAEHWAQEEDLLVTLAREGETLMVEG